MKTWIANHKGEIVFALLLLGALAIASLGYYFSRETDHPSVPDVTQTVATQEAVQTAITQIPIARATNDEAIKQAYEKAKADTMALSADAVVVELNLLLDELRGGSVKP